MVVVLCILVLLAWSSTQVVRSIFSNKVIPFPSKVEPVVQSVILVERTAVGGATAQASSAEEVLLDSAQLILNVQFPIANPQMTF